MSTTIKLFEQNNYLHLKNIISKEQVDFIKNSIMYEIIQDPNKINEKLVGPETNSKYASPTTEALTVFLIPILEKFTGLSLIPTFSYYRLYGPQNFLKKHTDREACEIAVTINLGYDYTEVKKDYTWDIFINNQPFKTMPGDLVVYRGIELEHYREPMQGGKNSWHLQAFLFYVDANGKYTNFAYDERPGMGYKKTLQNNNFKNVV